MLDVHNSASSVDKFAHVPIILWERMLDFRPCFRICGIRNCLVPWNALYAVDESICVPSWYMCLPSVLYVENRRIGTLSGVRSNCGGCACKLYRLSGSSFHADFVYWSIRLTISCDGIDLDGLKVSLEIDGGVMYCVR